MSSPNTNGYSASAAAAAAAAGRKRQTPSAPVYSPNETLNQMTQEAEQRQQDKYIVQKEIRAIRAQEMEKQRKEDEEREKEELNNQNNSRYNSRSSSVTTSSGSSQKGRLNSVSRQLDDNSIIDPDNPRELKRRLAELEEKYTKHAVYQTQFENDNQKLLYEVDILKDIIEEHDELIVELRRQFKDKSRELDFQKRNTKDIQTDFLRLKEILAQRDQLIQESGLILYTDNEAKDGLSNGDSLAEHLGDIKSVLPAALVSPETGKLLNMMGEGTIDDKLRKLLDTKHDLKAENSKLRLDLEDKENKIASLEKKLAQNASKIHDTQEQANDLHELQRQYTKEINDFKMKNQKLEHENIVIKQDLQRLQTQLKYMQTNFDELEQSEQRLNKEKREAQRELKESKNLIIELQDRVERLEISQKTFEKKRQLQKYADISSASLSTSYSLTPTQSTSLKTFNVEQTNKDSNESKETQQEQLMTNSTSTVTTESSSPVLSSRSSTSSSSASNSPTSSQETKEQTLNDENSIQDDVLSSSSTSSLQTAKENVINNIQTPCSTKSKKKSNDLETNDQEN